MSESQTIPAGYYLTIRVWLSCPLEYLNSEQINAAKEGNAIYEFGQMVKLGLLEEEGRYTGKYRPTKHGWLAYYDYETFWNCHVEE